MFNSSCWIYFIYLFQVIFNVSFWSQTKTPWGPLGAMTDDLAMSVRNAVATCCVSGCSVSVELKCVVPLSSFGCLPLLVVLLVSLTTQQTKQQEATENAQDEGLQRPWLGNEALMPSQNATSLKTTSFAQTKTYQNILPNILQNFRTYFRTHFKTYFRILGGWDEPRTVLAWRSLVRHSWYGHSCENRPGGPPGEPLTLLGSHSLYLLRKALEMREASWHSAAKQDTLKHLSTTQHTTRSTTSTRCTTQTPEHRNNPVRSPCWRTQRSRATSQFSAETSPFRTATGKRRKRRK